MLGVLSVGALGGLRVGRVDGRLVQQQPVQQEALVPVQLQQFALTALQLVPVRFVLLKRSGGGRGDHRLFRLQPPSTTDIISHHHFFMSFIFY